MKVEQITNGSLRVWLSEEELQQWGLLPPGEDSRRAAVRLVRRVLHQAPRPAGQLMAELIPVECGGVLLISAVPPTRRATPVVFRLFHADALLAWMARWRTLPAEEQLPYCVYEREGGYDLVVYPEESLSRPARWRITEYGEPMGCGEGLAAYCAERGRLLVDRNIAHCPVAATEADGL